MKFMIFISPKDFKDETLSMVKMLFDRWGISYDISSYSTKECIGYHGSRSIPSINAGKVNASDYNGIFIVDGIGIDSYKLFEFRPLLDLVMQFNNAGRYVCAVDNAVKIPARANIIKNKHVAAASNDELKRLILLFHGVPADSQIEMSGNLITIRDSGNIEESLDQLIEKLGVK